MKRFLFSIVTMLAISVSAQTFYFTLEDCLKFAFWNNYNRQAMLLTEQAREAGYQQSRQERFPSLNASLNESLMNNQNTTLWSGSYSVNARMPLFQGGAINRTIDQNRLIKEQAAYHTFLFENNLTIQILQVFFSILGNEEMLKYQRSIIEASAEQVAQGREQFRVGAILENDYLLLAAQYANDLNNILDTEIARNNNLLRLKNLLSMSPSETLVIIHPDTDAFISASIMPEKNDVINQALNTLPELKISRYNVDIANMNLKISRAAYFPTLNLSGSVGTGHSPSYSFNTQLAGRFNQQVGLSLSVPIYNSSRTRTRVAQNRIALQQAELDKRQIELDIKQNVAVEFQNLVSTFNRYRVNEIRQNALSRTFNVFRAQFNAGAITVVDLLQQQNNYISAMNDYIQTKYNFMLRRKILDIYMGVPIRL